MSKTASPKDLAGVVAALTAAKGEVLPYRQVFEQLNLVVPFTEAFVVSSLPRGGLQIVQPPRLPESLLRSYSKDFHNRDRLTWQAIAREKAVRAREAWGGEFEPSRFHSDFMKANGFSYAAALPLASPVLEGYPGALHVYRNAAQGPFNSDELEQLTQVASELDEAIARIRASRVNGENVDSATCLPEVLPHRPSIRQFIFDTNLNAPVPQADPTSVVDDRLLQNMLDDAKRRLEHVNGREVAADRVPLPDSRGDLWNFRVVTHKEYPALSSGPVVFFCLQPACCDWSSLRAVDFQADNEVARLIPALRFMREQFHRGPTLVEIAKTVHLSPFHFHRRFTELLGITPKHFLLDCQIQQAKRDLLERNKDLVKIAKDCGFAHQSHFTSRFKQATGLTPTRWRRMAMEAQHQRQQQ